MKPQFALEGTYVPDNLIVGGPIVTDEETIAAGAAHVRGEVLGKITVGGKLIKSVAAAVDGSEVPFCILAEDCDATLADQKAAVYKAGEFAQEKLTFGAGHTAASTKDKLRDLGIHLKSTVAA